MLSFLKRLFGHVIVPAEPEPLPLPIDAAERNRHKRQEHLTHGCQPGDTITDDGTEVVILSVGLTRGLLRYQVAVLRNGEHLAGAEHEFLFTNPPLEGGSPEDVRLANEQILLDAVNDDLRRRGL